MAEKSAPFGFNNLTQSTVIEAGGVNLTVTGIEFTFTPAVGGVPAQVILTLVDASAAQIYQRQCYLTDATTTISTMLTNLALTSPNGGLTVAVNFVAGNYFIFGSVFYDTDAL